MLKCVSCSKNLSEEESKSTDSIFPTCSACNNFEKLNLFGSKQINYISL